MHKPLKWRSEVLIKSADNFVIFSAIIFGEYNSRELL